MSYDKRTKRNKPNSKNLLQKWKENNQSDEYTDEDQRNKIRYEKSIKIDKNGAIKIPKRYRSLKGEIIVRTRRETAVINGKTRKVWVEKNEELDEREISIQIMDKPETRKLFFLQNVMV